MMCNRCYRSTAAGGWVALQHPTRQSGQTLASGGDEADSCLAVVEPHEVDQSVFSAARSIMSYA